MRADLNALGEAVRKTMGTDAAIDLPPLPSMRGKPLNYSLSFSDLPTLAAVLFLPVVLFLPPVDLFLA